jgi:hypothetical protein
MQKIERQNHAQLYQNGQFLKDAVSERTGDSQIEKELLKSMTACRWDVDDGKCADVGSKNNL